ncbi:hypothetical protein [Pelosinus sp. IPA-1]|uniref:hypothetical protein n=1 Tax=Pelosinus sp. IPA-1 TaxID=3029569 RepID=UPI002436204A|nr:hypothetical protein [Pelosinus sp. IPA-1]GMB01497.1 hypothetical protein PIPA1_42960 [Pelosinus sp. IPA-1]
MDWINLALEHYIITIILLVLLLLFFNFGNIVWIVIISFALWFIGPTVVNL